MLSSRRLLPGACELLKKCVMLLRPAVSHFAGRWPVLAPGPILSLELKGATQHMSQETWSRSCKSSESSWILWTLSVAVVAASLAVS